MESNRYIEARRFKLYKQNGSDCWRVALSNCLQIHPEKIPDFVNEFPTDWIKATRDWLQKKHNKAIIFIPSEILETNEYNRLSTPPGKCIVLVKDNINNETHAIFMYRGLLLQEHKIDKYDKVLGYFIVYNI